eukprot:3757401-Pyramimonas_sp.AAC.1
MASFRKQLAGELNSQVIRRLINKVLMVKYIVSVSSPTTVLPICCLTPADVGEFGQTRKPFKES